MKQMDLGPAVRREVRYEADGPWPSGKAQGSYRVMKQMDLLGSAVRHEARNEADGPWPSRKA